MPSRRRPRPHVSAANEPANTPSRSKTVRSRSSSSEYDQSTVARSVWWRSTAVRRPPVSSRNRSSSRPAISAGAHGDDARRRELDRERDAVEPAADLGDRARRRPRASVEVGASPRPLARRRDCTAALVDDRVDVRDVGGHGERPQRNHLLAVDGEALATRGEDAHVRTRRGSLARRAAPTASMRCSQLSSTRSRRFVLRNSTIAVDRAATPLRMGTPSVAATTCSSAVGAVRPRRARRTRRRRGSAGTHLGRDLEREARLADATDAGDA